MLVVFFKQQENLGLRGAGVCSVLFKADVNSNILGDMEELHMFADYVSWLSIETEAEANSDRFLVHVLCSLCLFLYLTLSIVHFGISIVSH